jgi:endo-1,4-beta-xylanase
MKCNSPLLLLPFTLAAFAFYCPLALSDDFDADNFAKALVADPKKRNEESSKFFTKQVSHWDPAGHWSWDEFQELEKNDFNLYNRQIENASKNNVLALDHWKLNASKNAQLKDGEETISGKKVDYFRIVIERKTSDKSVISFENAILKPIPIEGPVYFGFWARSPDRKNVIVSYELAENPSSDHKKVEMVAELTPIWRYYSCRFKVQPNSPGEHVLRFKLGPDPVTFELRKDLHFMVDDTPKRDRLSKESIADRIDFYRSGKLTIILQDNQNKPLKNIEVTVAQTKHEYRFGCVAPDLDSTDHSAVQRNLQNNLKLLFNMVVIPLNWNVIEPVEGKPDYSRIEAVAHWCQSNHLDILGKNLLSSKSYPGWAPADPSRASTLIRSHVVGTIGKLSGLVSQLELANDLLNTELKSQPNGEQTWIQSMPSIRNEENGPAAVALGKLLVWAHDADPKKRMKFLLGVDDPKKIDSLLASKQKFGLMPDAIELEEKVPFGLTPNELYNLLEGLKKYHTPVYLYVRCPVEKGNQHLEDTVQKAMNIYAIAYSHASICAIIWDGLIDHPGNQEKASGLLKIDGSPKPIYSALSDLIHKEWWTNITGTTDDTGSFNTAAFYGDYLVSAKNGKGQITSKQITFSKTNERKQTITLHI